MEFILHPWHLLVLVVSASINREQEKAIEYLQTENRVLREKLGKRRILLNDDQRRRLAVKGKVLGRKGLSDLATIVTPDTILRWHRQLVAQKWAYGQNIQPNSESLVYGGFIHVGAGNLDRLISAYGQIVD